MRAMESTQHTRPIWLGVLLASLTPATCTIFVGLASTSRLPPLTELLKTVGMLFVLITLVALAAVLLLGLPLVLWLRGRNALNAVYVCVGALAIGVVTWGLLVWSLTGRFEATNLSSLAAGASFGLVSGVAFCIGSAIKISLKQPIQ